MVYGDHSCNQPTDSDDTQPTNFSFPSSSTVKRKNRRSLRKMDGYQPEEGKSLLKRGRRKHRIAFLGIILLFVGLFVLIVMAMWTLSSKNGGKPAFPLYALHQSDPRICHLPPNNPGDRRANKDILKIVNFNVEWLFLYGGSGSIKCPTQSCPWATKEDAQDHLKRVAGVIAKIDADIVNLNEVEDCRVLRVLLDLLPEGHGYLPYLVASRDSATGQHTAFLTRVDPHFPVLRSDDRVSYPVPETECKRLNSGNLGVSKHHIAEIDVQDSTGMVIPFVFIGLHLLARPGDARRCTQREAQAVIIRNLAREYSKQGKQVIITGDFNDNDEEALGLDQRLPKGATLKILHDHGRFINCASLIPEEERYSCWFDANQNCRLDGPAERVMIDHFLMSGDWRPCIADVRIHHDWIPTCTDRVSDHFPISITLDLSKWDRR